MSESDNNKINIKKPELSDNFKIPEEYKISIDKAVYKWFISNNSELMKKLREKNDKYRKYMSSYISQHDDNYKIKSCSINDFFLCNHINEGAFYFSDAITTKVADEYSARSSDGKKIQPLITLLLAGCLPYNEVSGVKNIKLNSRAIADGLIDEKEIKKIILTMMKSKIAEWAGDITFHNYAPNKMRDSIEYNNNFISHYLSNDWIDDNCINNINNICKLNKNSNSNGNNISCECLFIADKISKIIIEIVENKKTISYESLIKMTEQATSILKNIDKLVININTNKNLKETSNSEVWRETQTNAMSNVKKKSFELFENNALGSWSLNLSLMGNSSDEIFKNNGGMTEKAHSSDSIKLTKVSNYAEQKIKELDDLINNGIENFYNFYNTEIKNGLIDNKITNIIKQRVKKSNIENNGGYGEFLIPYSEMMDNNFNENEITLSIKDAIKGVSLNSLIVDLSKEHDGIRVRMQLSLNSKNDLDGDGNTESRAGDKQKKHFSASAGPM